MIRKLFNDRLEVEYYIEITEFDRGEHYYDGHCVLEGLLLWDKKLDKMLPVEEGSKLERRLLGIFGGKEGLEEYLYDAEEIFEQGESETEGY